MKRTAQQKNLLNRISGMIPSAHELWYMAVFWAHRPLPSIYEDQSDISDGFRVYPLWLLGAIAIGVALFAGRPDSDVAYLRVPVFWPGFPHRWVYLLALISTVLSTAYWVGLLAWFWVLNPFIRLERAVRKFFIRQWEDLLERRLERERKRQSLRRYLATFKSDS
jgi:hypothetical protein